mmetsp:Transcript_28605/g.37470  ORF Transcript_28605/g.37470 Transcript_28605/m.37470 type:complete len:237 (-) Transcript_28605:261-971(-)|eukprot:CAMPEP_0117780536 /NCGR_PEP_ID=MMETSP0948-20121206/2281_1 /TAXON_ID=44440 /ORGANISM="Chattonella subsalsa, Strain CCMP2191" /LENGTH=236 /DNA_ID=CAMNT_0005608339 /DNA_START=33 /DNA_END=743 /DNA_ORIENTATION=+
MAGEVSLGPSYLQVLEDRLTQESNEEDEEDGKLALTFSRILVAALVNEGNEKTYENIIDFHEVFIENHRLPDGLKTTGILFAQNTCMLHLVETTLDVSEAYLKCLSSQEQKGVISKVKILHMAEDCPTQLFSKWYNNGVDRLVGAPEATVDLGDLVEATHDTLMKLYNAADVLKKSATELKRRYLHLVPSETKIQAFAENHGFMDLEEYSDIYESPIDIDLESESVWPLQPLVDYF